MENHIINFLTKNYFSHSKFQQLPELTHKYVHIKITAVSLLSIKIQEYYKYNKKIVFERIRITKYAQKQA